MSDIPDLPPGYALDETPQIPDLPPGYSLDEPKPKQEPSFLANTATGLAKGVGYIGGLPNTLASADAALFEGLGQSHPIADFIKQNTPTNEQAQDIVYRDINKGSEALTGKNPSLPYTPQTPAGNFYQTGLSAIAPSLAGGVGAVVPGVAGAVSSELYGQARPEASWWERVLAGLGGGLAGGIAQGAAGRALNLGLPSDISSMKSGASKAASGNAPDDVATEIQSLADARDAAVQAIPPGLTAQDAGQQFRSNLQSVLDQRQADRAQGGSLFDALGNNPAKINLKPSMDYATGLAAQNAGEVGQAYNAARGQFSSATGLTLDTPQFAQSALKGLGDLASNYQPGSAAQRAVLDVKGHLEDQLATQLPELTQARATWAANSKPLDVFDTKPFAQVLATDRFGRGYTMPNDAVVDQFLRGKGSADSLDALNKVFQDPQSSARALQDYLANIVQQKAILPDGSVDAKAMERALQPYQTALIRFPQVASQFKTAQAAQGALNQKTAYQQLYDTLGPEGSAAVSSRSPLIDQAYTPEQAATVRQVDSLLSQRMGKGGVSDTTSRLAGAIGGFLLEHVATEGHGGLGGPFVGQMAGSAAEHIFSGRSAAAIEQIRRQAIVDPTFAKSLLTDYNLKTPTAASQRAMNYVTSRLPPTMVAPMSQNNQGLPLIGPYPQYSGGM